MDYSKHYNPPGGYSSSPQNHYTTHQSVPQRLDTQKLYQNPREPSRQVVVVPKQSRKIRVVPVAHHTYEKPYPRQGRRTNYRKCILFGCVAFVILAAIAVGLAMYLIGKGNSGPAECKVLTFSSTIRFSYMQFKELFSDKTSDEYQELVNHFCANLTTGLNKQMKMNQCAKQPTDPCQVTSLEKGSVVVNFTVKQVVDSTNIKSQAAMSKQMEEAIENVVEEGKDSPLSDNNIFKQKTEQGDVSMAEQVTATQCNTLNLPENTKRLSSTMQTNLVGTTVSWVCKAGYKFPSTESTSSSTCRENGYWSYYPNKACVDIDECESNPCLNGATCVNVENGFNCTCPPAYTGAMCETKFDDCYPNPCENGATCMDLEDDYECKCPEGFSGDNCEINHDDCTPNQCQNGATCVDGANSYSCQCPEGLTGTNCETDIGECDSNPCQNNGTCVDDVNGYTCQCPQGFTGTNCDSDIDECASNPCQNDGTCVNEVGQFVCECVSGWAQPDCSTAIQQCDSNPCQNGGTCTDVFNGYECECVTGFAGPECATTCTALPDEILCIPFDLLHNDGFQTSTWLWLDLNQAPTLQPSCGVKDKCADFDGTDDLIEIPYFLNGYHYYRAFSVGFWFKRDSTSSGEKGLVTNECSGKSPTFFVNSNPGKISAGVITENHDVTIQYTDIAVTDDEWHHIALVYDGANVYLYVDNVKNPLSPAATGALKDSGCLISVGYGLFKGQMDEICIYAAGLTDDEVSSLYYQPTQCTAPTAPEE